MAALATADDFRNLKLLIAKIQEVAVLPHVVFKVLEITGSSDSPAADIEQAVLVDPGFSSKLLGLANSAHYGLPKKVTSIREAVMFLGFKAVRQMAMTVGVFDLFVGKNDRESMRRRDWWRRSVDAALCARAIARLSHCGNPDEAYTCGLLHLIGKTLLDRFGEGSYEDVESMIASGTGIAEAERSVFGLVHTEASVAAAMKWGLPPILMGSLSYLTEPQQDEEGASYRACVALGALIAEATVNTGLEVQAPEWVYQVLQLDPDNQAEITQVGITAIAQAGTMKV